MAANSSRTYSRNFLAVITLGVGLFAMLWAAPQSAAQSGDPVLPKLSVAKALFFKNNPEARSAFMAGLPRRPAGPPRPTSATVHPPVFGGNWTEVTSAPVSGLCNPLLLTDGSVIVHGCLTPDWYRLVPSITGDYATGTWSQIGSLPGGYGPQYNASAVLPDGRAIIMGGEYDSRCEGGNIPVWTSSGAIYDPGTGLWTSVSPPSGTGWTNLATCGGQEADGGIGDAASIVLPNGTFMISACCADPPLNALFNPSTLTWTTTGVPSNYQDEQGYTLLPTDKVMTVDVWDPPAAQQYSYLTGAWSAIAGTPVSLVDPTTCGNYEIGPAVMRPDGTVVAFGGNTGCTASPADPTAIYTVSSNSWLQGPNVPATCGGLGTTSCDLADAPAALLPNGNILFAASDGYGNSPTHFFEFTTANAISQVSDPKFFAINAGAYYYNFLVLPNGQILMTDFSEIAEVYAPTGSPNAAWAPTISSVPTCVSPGSSYVVSGTQLNGLSQGAAYGDDVQGATNYPLVRIKNNTSGHVFYATTSGHSTMSIAPGLSGSTNFKVAASTETGASTLYVVANGIPSAGQAITVGACATLQTTPATNIAATGNQGGPFSPSSFQYQLSASSGSLNYAISGIPSWLNANITSGTATTTPTTVTFSVVSAGSLTPGTYDATIAFGNSSTGIGNTTRDATLTVLASKSLAVTPPSGAAPLAVVFKTPVQNGDANTYTVNFGDASAHGTMTIAPSGSACVTTGPCYTATASISHSYTTGGVYTATLLNSALTGVATTQVTVSGGAPPPPQAHRWPLPMYRGEDQAAAPRDLPWTPPRAPSPAWAR